LTTITVLEAGQRNADTATADIDAEDVHDDGFD
jgi:hypothetical protein